MSTERSRFTVESSKPLRSEEQQDLVRERLQTGFVREIFSSTGSGSFLLTSHA